MQRDYYLNLAKDGLHFPIGADLVLREDPDHEAILHDGVRLGKVVANAARRYKTPLAMPVMDLMLEKAWMLRALGGISEADIPTWHFSSTPTKAQITQIRDNIISSMDKRFIANVEAVRYIAEHTKLLPVGMSIGPFSLMTKLVSDPITPAYFAGMGETAQENDDVKMIETILELATEVILHSVRAQVKAGAKAFFIAEPAANAVYISPLQISRGSDVFERLPMKYLRKIKAELDAAGVDLFFHCCGELTNEMIRYFVSLDPAILSLGSSRKLWEDAAIVPKDIVLFGNLPSKRFFSDEMISVAEVRRLAIELLSKMEQTGHPYILGTECDVLCVPGCEKPLMEKVMAIVNCRDDHKKTPSILLHPDGGQEKIRA